MLPLEPRYAIIGSVSLVANVLLSQFLVTVDLYTDLLHSQQKHS